MLGGFKWHRNAEGGGCVEVEAEGWPPDPGLPRVPLHCQRETHRSLHMASRAPPPHISLQATQVLHELQASTWSLTLKNIFDFAVNNL